MMKTNGLQTDWQTNPWSNHRRNTGITPTEESWYEQSGIRCPMAKWIQGLRVINISTCILRYSWQKPLFPRPPWATSLALTGRNSLLPARSRRNSLRFHIRWTSCSTYCQPGMTVLTGTWLSTLNGIPDSTATSETDNMIFHELFERLSPCIVS